MKKTPSMKTGPEGTHRRRSFHLPARTLNALDSIVARLKIRARDNHEPLPSASAVVEAAIDAEVLRLREALKG